VVNFELLPEYVIRYVLKSKKQLVEGFGSVKGEKWNGVEGLRCSTSLYMLHSWVFCLGSEVCISQYFDHALGATAIN